MFKSVPIEIPQECPWSGIPHVDQVTCEAGLCFWIRQPANVTSSIAFLIVAYLLLRRPSRVCRNLGLISIFIGIGSALVHGTHARVGGLVDFSAQYLFLAWVFGYSCMRLSWTRELSWPVILTIWITWTGLIYWDDRLSVPLHIFTVVCLVVVEMICLRRFPGMKLGSLFASLGFLVFGFFLFILDATKIVCDPNNHFFQLHAMWHICAAICVYFSARYLDQFKGHY